jgi:hypothetical protein
MPYLQVFFVTRLFQAVEKRKKFFSEMLDEESNSGLYKCFLRAGL